MQLEGDGAEQTIDVDLLRSDAAVDVLRSEVDTDRG